MRISFKEYIFSLVMKKNPCLNRGIQLIALIIAQHPFLAQAQHAAGPQEDPGCSSTANVPAPSTWAGCGSQTMETSGFDLS